MKKNNKQKLSYSKILIISVLVICLQIIIYAEYAMLKLGDISAMYVLIGVPTTLIPMVVSYMNKSKSENTKGGIVYENSIREMQNYNDGASG